MVLSRIQNVVLVFASCLFLVLGAIELRSSFSQAPPPDAPPQPPRVAARPKLAQAPKDQPNQEKEPTGKPVEVDSFHSISILGRCDVIVKQGKEDSVVVGEQVGIGQVQAKVQNGVLMLLGGTVGGTVHVEVKTLKGLSIAGSGSMRAEYIDTKELSVSVTGTGSIQVTGKAETLKLNILGTGNFDGTGFETQRADVRHAGTGRAIVKVQSQLTAQVLGIGSVEYIGSPQVRLSRLGLGTVRKRP